MIFQRINIQFNHLMYLLLLLVIISINVLVVVVFADLSSSSEKDTDNEEYNIDKHDPVEDSEDFWQHQNYETLRTQLSRTPNVNVAKNIILFIGDGMSLSTITSARIMDGQRHGANGEDNSLSWESFPFTGLSKTYCVNKQVPDSACTGTAYWSGVKNNLGTLGVTAEVKLKDCAAVNTSTTVKTMLDYGHEAGKATGIVTTTRVTHASPAAGYAHSADRDYEVDAKVIHDKQNPKMCIDIANQLVNYYPGKDVNVILGGGTTNFLPITGYDKHGNQGSRLDGVDLVEQWRRDKNIRFNGGEVVAWDLDDLNKVDYNSTTHLLGLFTPSHMSYNLEADRTKEPSLEQMTEAAIKILKNNENGFVLFVEGGKIDLGHHASQARKALDETIELSKAVSKAMAMTSPEDTLIVVTSDHSHTMSISGYPARGTNILKFAGKSEVDGMPYTILSYANGMVAGRKHINSKDLDRVDSTWPSLVPMQYETHSGEDVIVYSSGPWAHILGGVYEQTYIPTAMKYASCIGPGPTACNHYNFHQSKIDQGDLLHFSNL